MWYWVDAMRNLFVRPYLLRERSIRGCASYKVRPLLGARDFLSDLFEWQTFDYQSLHWKPASLLHVSIEPPQRISRYIVYANTFMKDVCVCVLCIAHIKLCA